MLLVCLIGCFLIPNVKGIERYEEEFLWKSMSPDNHIIIFYGLEINEKIYWDFETFGEPFEVSLEINGIFVLTYEPVYSGYIIIKEYPSTARTIFIFFKEDQLEEGTIKIIISNESNFSISSYPLFLILGIIGIIAIFKIKRLRIW